MNQISDDELYKRAAERIKKADTDPNHRGIPFQEAISKEEWEEFLKLDPDEILDDELFE